MYKLLSATAVVGLLASYPAQAQMAFHYNGPVESPRQNQIRAAHYTWLVRTDPSFRAYRKRKECGPIRFLASLRQDCLASFDVYEPRLF